MDNSVEKLAQKYQFTTPQLINIFESLPLNVFYKDIEGIYKLASHTCKMLSGDREDFTIIGKTDKEVQLDKELGLKFYNEDLEIAKSGEDRKYIQPMTFGESTFYYEISKKPVKDTDGNIIGIIGVVSDITELILAQKKLERISFIDTMTDCYNRSYFERYKEEIFNTKRPFALIMADCNNLKKINDNYGHNYGDAYIKACVFNIQKNIPEEGIIIRLGGDEFLVIIYDFSLEECEALVKKLIENSNNFKIMGRSLSVAYGYTLVDSNANSFDDAIKIADEAMYKNKMEQKKNCKAL